MKINEYKIGDYVQFKDTYNKIRKGKIEKIVGNTATIKIINNNILTFVTDNIPIASIKNKISNKGIIEIKLKQQLRNIIREEIKKVFKEGFADTRITIIDSNKLKITDVKNALHKEKISCQVGTDYDDNVVISIGAEATRKEKEKIKNVIKKFGYFSFTIK